MPSGKFRRPRLSRSVIDRTWLFRRSQSLPGHDSDDGRPDGVVTLVCAPAGAGKTTLLADWARICGQRGDLVAWVSLDRTDDDPDLFWQALVVAVRDATNGTEHRSGARSGQPDAPVPADHPLPHAASLAELDRLLELAAAPVWLFLDDLQEISSPGVLAGLDTLLRTLPPELHLVLASRRDPALALHRLRLTGGLREIRASDLALERGDVRQVLLHHGVVLDDEALSLLVERTEGWAAGVRLAALALTDAADPAAVVRHFAGDDRAVADYLSAEVLVRLDRREQHLLRLCALPERLTAALAVELTGDPAAADLLEDLSRANVLVAPVPPGGWYRIHTLLRGYLAAQLQRTDDPDTRSAHSRIARWYADRGHLCWAVEHAVKSGDDALALELLTTHGPGFLTGGQARALHALIGASTEAVRADVTVQCLDTLAVLEDDEAAKAHLPTPREDLPEVLAASTTPVSTPAPDARLDALVALHRVRQHVELSPPVLEASAGLLDGRADDLELLLSRERGRVLLLAGRFGEADAELSRAKLLAEVSGNGHTVRRVNAHLTALAAARGRFHDVPALAERTVRITPGTDGMHDNAVAGALLSAAHAARQRLESDDARQLAERAAGLADRTASPEVLSSLRSLLAVLDVEDGADPLAGCRLLRAESSFAAEHSLSPLVVIQLAFAEHRCAWLAGRLDWAHEALRRLETPGLPPGELATLTATEHLARGRTEAARHRVLPVVHRAARCMFETTLQQAWLIEALISASAGQRARCQEALRCALELAEETGALRAFLDLPGILGLLDDGVGRFGRSDDLVERIRAAARQRTDHPVVPMTPRELALLNELPAQLTLEDIAARHQVSVNTVKTHVRSIYRKLGASSRRDAIACARRRGLL